MQGNEEYIFLKSENERLLDENQKLRLENTELKKTTIEHKHFR